MVWLLVLRKSYHTFRERSEEIIKKIEELEIKTLTQKELNEFTQEQLLRQKEQMLREDALSMERRQFEQSLSQGERTAPVTTAEDDMFSDSEQALETKEEKKQVKKVKKSKDLFHFE